MGALERLRAWDRRRRARKEARALVTRSLRALRRYSYRILPEAFAEVQAGARALEDACRRRDHDATCAGLVAQEALVERHLSFARKSAFREYADSIAVAVLIALFLRAFVVEAFKIPSGSMIPTMEVGDHIFVNKFIYGLRVPFTTWKFFEWRAPHRGEVVVFIYPADPGKDFIKRIVGLEGDSIQVRRNVLIVNGRAVERQPLPGLRRYWDYDEAGGRWQERLARLDHEALGDDDYVTMYDPHGGYRDYPLPGEGCAHGMEVDPANAEACVVPKGHVFVMGDNRNNSHDSRYWGPVPVGNIKGKALVVWWSSGGPDGVRWGRLGKSVE